MTNNVDFSSDCFYQYKDNRDSFEKFQHRVQAIFGQFLYYFELAPLKVFSQDTPITPIPTQGEDGKFHYNLKALPWNQTEKSEGLYLFVHGLHGTPLHWKKYFPALEKKKPGVHYVAPHVPSKGNCPLEQACIPILQIVKNYLEKHPGKPIHLIGTSNGSRIISYIETQLDTASMKGRTLTVTSIAGVHHGTTWITTLEKTRLAVLHSKLVKELAFESEFSKILLGLWKAKQEEWKAANINVRHYFYATTEDELVQPLSSSLPIIDEKDTHRIYHGCGHSQIVEKVREVVLNTIDGITVS